jgi:hypothetical protein
LTGSEGVARRDEAASVVEAGAVTLALRERATTLKAQFEALPLQADGSIRVPPALRRAIVDLALDVLCGPESRAKAGAPEILRILTTARRP